MNDSKSYSRFEAECVDWCRCGNLEVDRDRFISTARDLEAAEAIAANLADALAELTSIMDAAVTGDYTPDTFTTQPAKFALHAYNLHLIRR